MKKFLITENDKKYIRRLYNLNEDDGMVKGFMDLVKQKLKQGSTSSDTTTSPSDGSSSTSSTSSTSSSSSDSTSSDSSSDNTTVQAGEYFVHPNADTITLNYYPSAIKLNSDAEKLLKSIFAEAGTPELKITSTLRTYEDQARVNLQNSRSNIAAWYGNDVVQVWDKYKAGQMTQQEYADYLRDRDKKRGGLMSNHLSGLAIDVAPYSEKFASTAEKLMKQGKSGIKKVLREKSNGAVHIEFLFPVTDKGGASSTTSKSPTNKSERKADKAITKQGIIIDTKDPSSNRYGLVYGGTPSAKYGAQFMYNQGASILNKNMIYANNEIPIATIEATLKASFPNAEIKSVSGFSGGGPKTIEAMNSGKYDFIGLIDPYISKEYKDLPSNVKMISRGDNWGGYPNVRTILKNMEANGVSQLISANSYNHDSMPAKFFTDYGNLV